MKKREFKVGDRVHYHTIIGEPHDGKVYQIWALEPNLGGNKQAVAWLVGKSGCVSQQALSAAAADVDDAFAKTYDENARRRGQYDAG